MVNGAYGDFIGTAVWESDCKGTRGLNSQAKSTIRSMLANKNFILWLPIGWRLCCQPIMCQDWKSLLISPYFSIGTKWFLVTKVPGWINMAHVNIITVQILSKWTLIPKHAHKQTHTHNILLAIRQIPVQHGERKHSFLLYDFTYNSI